MSSLPSTNKEHLLIPPKCISYIPSSVVSPVVRPVRVISLFKEMPKPRSSLPPTNMEKAMSSLPLTNKEHLLIPPKCMSYVPSSVVRPVVRPVRVISLFKEMPKPRSSLPPTNMEKSSKTRDCIKFKKFLRIRQTGADKQYKKSHKGNGWKKPFIGSFHSKDFLIHDETCIQAKQPISATPDSGSGPSNTVSSVSSIEEIRKRVDLLAKKLALDSTPKQDVTFHNLDWNYFFCWVSESTILAPPHCQSAGECWCIAMARGYEYYVAVNKINVKEHPTPLKLWQGVSSKHLSRRGGINNIENAKKYMVKKSYVKDMVVHRRPSDDFEGFERLLDVLLARGPVVVVFDCLPSYENYDGKDIYIPDDMECQAAVYESFIKHSAVVTGCGVKVSRGKVIEYWRTHDSQGADWGVGGFGALARHKGLIIAAVEFKF